MILFSSAPHHLQVFCSQYLFCCYKHYVLFFSRIFDMSPKSATKKNLFISCHECSICKLSLVNNTLQKFGRYLCVKGIRIRNILVHISRIWTEYREIIRISPYAVRMPENTYQNNSEHGYFLRIVPFRFSDILRTSSEVQSESPVEHLRRNFLRK